jgi:hypothetical protein
MSREDKPESLKVTPVSEFKKKSQTREEGELVRLPSGFVVRLRRPNLIPLLKQGVIPAELFEVITKQSGGDFSPKTTKEIQDGIEAVDTILIAAFIEPKLVRENPNEDEISLDNLDDEDRGAAYIYVQQGVKDFKFFRSQPTSQRSGFVMSKVSRKKAK